MPILISQFALVALGGALGAVLRYASGLWLMRFAASGGFPWPTFSVNMLGAFAIGVAAALLPPDARGWRLFLMVGLLGGFTTFSAFAFELFALFERRQFILLAAYGFGSVLAGFIAFCGGLFSVRAAMGGA